MKLTSEQFEKLITKMSETSYIPDDVNDALRAKGYSGALDGYSISKEGAISAVKEMQKAGLLSKYKSALDILSGSEFKEQKND